MSTTTEKILGFGLLTVIILALANHRSNKNKLAAIVEANKKELEDPKKKESVTP